MDSFHKTIKQVSKLFLKFNQNNLERKELKQVCLLLEILEQSRDKYLNTNDPRFNSIFWADSVRRLTEQIEFWFSWMQAFAKRYEDEFDPRSGPSGDYIPVTYYADNTIVQIISCRHKLALMVGAYFKPFDPERGKLPDFQAIMKRLKKPDKHGLDADLSKSFLEHLKKLENPDFKFLKNYRDYKIHGNDPLIIMGEIANHHFRGYRYPLKTQKEIEKWEREMKEVLRYDEETIQISRKGSTFGGVQYITNDLKNFLWEFNQIKNSVENCVFLILESFSGCLKILIDQLELRKVED